MSFYRRYGKNPPSLYKWHDKGCAGQESKWSERHLLVYRSLSDMISKTSMLDPSGIKDSAKATMESMRDHFHHSWRMVNIIIRFHESNELTNITE